MFVCPTHNKLYSNKSANHGLCVKLFKNLNVKNDKKLNNNKGNSGAPVNKPLLPDDNNNKKSPHKYIPL